MAAALKGLGRGIEALISAGPQSYYEEKRAGVVNVDINKVEPNKDQPRKYFNEDLLTELAESIKEFGIIQPLIVKDEIGYYSIIAGERRWRAARIAKITEVPVIIKDYNDLEIIQIALIENIQRQDLNPIEEALCYKRLIDDYFFSTDEISQKVGKSKSTIHSLTNLLNLDQRVQSFIIEGKLQLSHGRVLMNLKNMDKQFELAEKIIDDELSVRETDKLLKIYLEREEVTEDKKEIEVIHKALYDYRSIENNLKNIFGTQVKIKDGKNKGKVEIEYYSQEELDRLLGIFHAIDSTALHGEG